jgi:ribonuclease P protein subunit RPR2
MTPPVRREVASPVGLVITVTAIAATAAFVVLAPTISETVAERPVQFLEFLLLSFALQLFSVRVYGGGRIGVSAIGLLACGFALGVGPAMLGGTLAALVAFVRGRGLLHRAIFDASQFALSAGSGAAVYHAVTALDGSVGTKVGAACAAGLVYTGVNNSLLCLAIGADESRPMLEIWRERFRWARFHYLAFGPLALACLLAYDAIGVAGLGAFALPPALLLLSVQQYIDHTRVAAEKVAGANAELRVANTELEARNEDLRQLFDFTGGLAAHAHDRAALVAFAEQWLTRTTGATARIRIGIGSGGIALVAGGKQVGSLSLIHGDRFDDARWRRLAEAIIPQLATAIESAELVEKVRKTHLATIAALSRSIEAKDNYTGDHTERVAAVAVALARRLGFEGGDLDAIEIGALLHDVGKIGVPERILQKNGPLDEEEWEVMKRHPLVSEYILSDVELPAIVREIARWSHERVDGTGYPDGLDGDQIPLAARIVLVADALDALTSDRPYRPARHLEAAVDELRANTGTQFCATVIEALELIYREEPHLLMSGQLQAVGAA